MNLVYAFKLGGSFFLFCLVHLLVFLGHMLCEKKNNMNLVLLLLYRLHKMVTFTEPVKLCVIVVFLLVL